MTDQPRKRITIDAPSEATILAARHLDATEGPVQIGRTVDTSTRSAITQVLRYISTAHNSPAVPAGTPLVCSDERHAVKVADLERRLDAARRMLNPDDVRLVDEMAATVEQKMDQAAQAEAERDGAYRERAHLVAWLAALHPAVIAPAPDVDEPGWQILYLYAGGWQMSWHIAPRDAELFSRVEHVSANDPRAQWDGHETDAKYARIRQHTRLLQLRGQDPYERCICSSTMAGLELCARCPGHDRPTAGQPLDTDVAAAVRDAGLPPGTVVTRAVVDEALRQMDADPHGLKAGMVVQSYREYGQEKWVFRCWGTDTCDGFLFLDHGSQQSAERARDRHVAEEHTDQPKEQPRV